MASPQVEQLAERHRASQVALRAGLTRDSTSILRQMFDPARPEETWPPTRDALERLMQDRRGVSAGLASRYYRDSREQADVTGRFVPITPASLTAELAKAVLDATGISVFARALRAGQTPEKALATTGVTLAGSTSRLVLNAGRDTIRGSALNDSQALGWARITDAGPCAFCAMLASRGPAYKSRQTAEFHAHDHCACMPVPVFNRNEAWLQHSQDLYTQWQDATRGLSGEEARKVWRRHWSSRSSAPEADSPSP